VEAAARRGYALVLMDCQMPGMDGYEATRLIRANEGARRRTPIVAMTASALQADRDRCFAAGMDDHLPKPFNPEELATILARWSGATVAGEAHASPDGAESGPLNAHVVADLRALGADFLRESVSLFLTSTPPKIAALQQAQERGDVAALRQKAHSLRGSCGLIGAHRMMELCARLEDQADHARGDAARELVLAVTSAFRDADAALQAELAALPA
jgi:CheY-like chemotaxis protein